MGQILPNRGDVVARLTAPKSCQALRDAPDSVGVAEDFQVTALAEIPQSC
jgi:hypothetical protein